VLAKRSSDLLHGLDAGTHGLTAPLVEKLPGPGGRAVIPELLECFLEKVGPDGLQVVAEAIAQSEALLGLQILFPLEQEPARLFQERCPAFARYAARFSGADLAPFAELIVTGRRQMAARADCDRTLARSYGHFDALLVGTEVGLLVDKTPEAMAAV